MKKHKLLITLYEDQYKYLKKTQPNMSEYIRRILDNNMLGKYNISK